MVYYCEVDGENDPHFEGFSHTTDKDEDALKHFQDKFGAKLDFVYNEDFEVVYER
jgi:hypothetical protein